MGKETEKKEGLADGPRPPARSQAVASSSATTTLVRSADCDLLFRNRLLLLRLLMGRLRQDPLPAGEARAAVPAAHAPPHAVARSCCVGGSAGGGAAGWPLDAAHILAEMGIEGLAQKLEVREGGRLGVDAGGRPPGKLLSQPPLAPDRTARWASSLSNSRRRRVV